MLPRPARGPRLWERLIERRRTASVTEWLSVILAGRDSVRTGLARGSPGGSPCRNPATRSSCLPQPSRPAHRGGGRDRRDRALGASGSGRRAGGLQPRLALGEPEVVAPVPGL